MQHTQRLASAVERPVDYFRAVRQQSLSLCQPLAIEDFGVQPMADASPPKWHLAHTTWFFETFILKPFVPGYQAFHPDYEYLFNSYYNGVGEQYPRVARGNLSRPTVAQVFEYRKHVDEHMASLLHDSPADEVVARTTLGVNHEQQHQELLLTDLKYNLGRNPLYPTYGEPIDAFVTENGGLDRPLTYSNFDGGVVEIGAQNGFCFDNELPRHEVLTRDFALADRVVTNAEYLAFVQADGYTRSEFWLSEAWAQLQQVQWRAPLYWVEQDNQWYEYQLRNGLQPLVLDAPVAHVSFFEAEAFARFAGCRLPTEQEWEHAASRQSVVAKSRPNFVDTQRYAPAPSSSADQPLDQLFGDVWEWTQSAYSPYPGYRPLPGTLGEYNGKFMSSQIVLRGGSCFTPEDHIRPSYRNFFYPPDRWQMSGIRLAFDV